MYLKWKIYHHQKTIFNQVAVAFERALDVVGNVDSWIDVQLNPVNDHHLTYQLPPGCKLLQAAVRQNGAQYGDSSVINRLSKGQKDLLRAHEALYYIVQVNGGNSSDQVRSFLRVLLNENATRDETDRAVEYFEAFIVELYKTMKEKEK